MGPEPTFTFIVSATPAPPTAPAAPPPPERPPASSATWSGPARLAACALAGLALALLAARTAGLWPVTRPTDPVIPVQRIDLNNADRAELMQLPGVGPALAESILDHRSRQGPFRTVDDLAHVHGLGPTTLARLRPWVEVGPPSVVTSLPAEKGPAPARAARKSPPATPIDPNRATAEELQRLPGVGPTMAERIIEARAKAPFRTADDLRRVRGIGKKTLEKLRPCLRFEGEGK